MKKEQVLELMNAIPHDLVAEADIQAPAKRRMPKIARTGLIAACLCLALLGTAFAANPEALSGLIDRLTVRQVSAEYNCGYLIEGQVIQYPLSAFSPALLAASEGRDTAVVSLTFDTWEEVQAFLGEDIPCVCPEGWDTDLIQVLLFHTESEVLWGVKICSVDFGCQTSLDITIYTEHWLHRNDEIAGLMGLSTADVEYLSSYPMPNGSQAELVLVTDPQMLLPDGTFASPLQQCFGYFMRDGILYSVTAHSSVPPHESTEAQLQTVLDSFP